MSDELLRRLSFFAGLSAADMDWLSARAEPVTVAAGELVLEEGAPGDAAYVIVDGEFEIVKKSDGQDIVIAVREPGAIIGEMSLLDDTSRNATVRAVRRGNLLKIRADTFHQLLERSSGAALSMLHTVSGRLHQNEAMLRQSEKMAALGTLSAGLAHELNNPAAAVIRSSGQLQEALTGFLRAASGLDGLGLGADLRQRLDGLGAEIAGRKADQPDPGLRPPDEREQELRTWLEGQGVDEAWEIAPALAAWGWERSALADLCRGCSPAQLRGVAAWLAGACNTYTLLDEVRTGAGRLAEIVRAVKAYAYLDQAPVQEVDVNADLENTLVILRHKLGTGVKVVRQFDPGLPHIEAYSSELNQVWTNLIDNAIDGLGGRGQITLRTVVQDGDVAVEVADDGPGIPPEIQKRIFEPFFTTKAPGKGTGLGLHIVYTIVHKHGGHIEVDSRPGATCFRVCLPLRLPHA
jgi:signal transduction histidine kinase